MSAPSTPLTPAARVNRGRSTVTTADRAPARRYVNISPADTGEFVVVFDLAWPHGDGDVIPQVHGQYRTEREAIAVARELAGSKRIAVRLERWTCKGRTNVGGMTEEVIATFCGAP